MDGGHSVILRFKETAFPVSKFATSILYCILYAKGFQGGGGKRQRSDSGEMNAASALFVECKLPFRKKGKKGVRACVHRRMPLCVFIEGVRSITFKWGAGSTSTAEETGFCV
jgi:hypothetical protein